MTAPWRQGRKVGRTLYDADDRLIGVMDTLELAARVVQAVNRCTCGNEGLGGRRHESDCPVFVLWDRKHPPSTEARP